MVARNRHARKRQRPKKRPRLKKRPRPNKRQRLDESPRPEKRSGKTVCCQECAGDLTALAARISTTID
jgi:hypothetical protein